MLRNSSSSSQLILQPPEMVVKGSNNNPTLLVNKKPQIHQFFSNRNPKRCSNLPVISLSLRNSIQSLKTIDDEMTRSNLPETRYSFAISSLPQTQPNSNEKNKTKRLMIREKYSLRKKCTH
jgi:hypothetical protein